MWWVVAAVVFLAVVLLVDRSRRGAQGSRRPSGQDAPYDGDAAAAHSMRQQEQGWGGGA